MTRNFKLKNLGCANCAAKMERKISALPHVTACSVVFMTAKLSLEAADTHIDDVVSQAKQIIRTLEPQVELVRI